MDTTQEFSDRTVRGYDLGRLEANVKDCAANVVNFKEAIKKEQRQIEQLSDIIRRKKELDKAPLTNEVVAKPRK